MTWSVGRFTHAHLFCGALLCGFSLAVVAIEHLIDSNQTPVLLKKKTVLKKRHLDLSALSLKTPDLIEKSFDLKLPFQSSAWVFRPGGMMPEGAICLRDVARGDERDVTLEEPIYLRRENGVAKFALLGEKRPLWVVPKRLGDHVFLDTYISVRGEDHFLKREEIPFDGAKPWPKGVSVEGIVVDERLLERLGTVWYGEDRKESGKGERIAMQKGVCFAKVGDWLMIKDGYLQKVSGFSAECEALFQLKKKTADHLEFEVVDSDAQHKLFLRLARSHESLDERALSSIAFLGRRQLDTVQIGVEGRRLVASLGSSLFCLDGKWGSDEKKGSLELRLNCVEVSRKKKALFATLFSPQKSIAKEVILGGAL